MTAYGVANRIPFEIWLQIKDFMGPESSSSLYSVNRTWFEIVMNARYRDLDITRLNDDVVSRLPLVKCVFPCCGFEYIYPTAETLGSQNASDICPSLDQPFRIQSSAAC